MRHRPYCVVGHLGIAASRGNLDLLSAGPSSRRVLTMSATSGSPHLVVSKYQDIRHRAAVSILANTLQLSGAVTRPGARHGGLVDAVQRAPAVVDIGIGIA